MKKLLFASLTFCATSHAMDTPSTCEQACLKKYDENKNTSYNSIQNMRGNIFASDLRRMALYKTEMKYNLFILKHCIKKCNEQK